MGKTQTTIIRLAIQRGQNPLQNRHNQILTNNQHDDRNIKQGKKTYQLQERRIKSTIKHENAGISMELTKRSHDHSIS